MKVYINFQTEDEVREANIELTPESIKDWVAKNLRTRGDKLFVVLPSETPNDVYITSSPTDVELFMENLLMSSKLFIQEFEFGDYKEVFGYLQDLYEVAPDRFIDETTISAN